MNIYVTMSVGLLIGTVLHAANSIRKINKRNPDVDFKTVLNEYLRNDKVALLVSLICSIALLWISSDFIDLKNLEAIDKTESLKDRIFHFRLAQWIKTSSVIAGYFSDYIVYGWLGKTKGIIAEKFKPETDKP